MNTVKKLSIQLLVIASTFSYCNSFGTELDNFLSVKSEFMLVTDKHKQASLWATCAATYSFVAELARKEGQEQQAKFSEDVSRGASVAVAMTYMVKFLSDDTYSEEDKISQFGTRWESAKQLMSALPESRMTYLLAQLEGSSSKESAEFMDKLTETVRVCTDNEKGQQGYIDIYREMAASGMLTSPRQAE
jgi:hypothetical protein